MIFFLQLSVLMPPPSTTIDAPLLCPFAASLILNYNCYIINQPFQQNSSQEDICTWFIWKSAWLKINLKYLIKVLISKTQKSISHKSCLEKLELKVIYMFHPWVSQLCRVITHILTAGNHARLTVPYLIKLIPARGSFPESCCLPEDANFFKVLCSSCMFGGIWADSF